MSLDIQFYKHLLRVLEYGSSASSRTFVRMRFKREFIPNTEKETQWIRPPRSQQFLKDVLITRCALKAKKGYSGPMHFFVFYLQTVVHY